MTAKRAVESNSWRAEALGMAAYEAYALLQKAHGAHERALNLGVGTRRQRLEYAEAVMRYSNIVMNWLRFLDSAEKDAARFVDLNDLAPNERTHLLT